MSDSEWDEDKWRRIVLCVSRDRGYSMPDDQVKIAVNASRTGFDDSGVDGAVSGVEVVIKAYERSINFKWEHKPRA